MKRTGIFLLLLTLAWVPGWAVDRPAPEAGADIPPPPPPEQRGGRGMKRLGPATWRAFGNLNEAERQKLMELQQSNPEEFRKQLDELGRKWLEAERAKLNALKRLAATYKSSIHPEEKEKLAKQIEESVRQDFYQRLKENRRHLEEMKRNAARVEMELNKRAERADEAIQARTRMILERGEVLPPPRPQHNGPRSKEK